MSTNQDGNKQPRPVTTNDAGIPAPSDEHSLTAGPGGPILSQKRMPDTGLRSNNAQWDFWTLSPESAHQVIILLSDRGTPCTYRNMNGYSSHTYLWVNAGGERFWVQYHFKTEQGIQNFTD